MASSLGRGPRKSPRPTTESPAKSSVCCRQAELGGGRLARAGRGGAGERQIGGPTKSSDSQHLALSANVDFIPRKSGKIEIGARHRLVRDDELALVSLAEPFEPAGGVDGVADRGNRGGVAVSHLPNDHRPAMDTDANTQGTIELALQRQIKLTEPLRHQPGSR